MNIRWEIRNWWRRLRGCVVIEIQTGDGEWIDITKNMKSMDIEKAMPDMTGDITTSLAFDRAVREWMGVGDNGTQSR